VTARRSLYAAVDVGSHSAKLLIARPARDGSWQSEFAAVTVTGLGGGGALGLDPAGRSRAIATLRDFAAAIAARNVAGVAAVGTMALRQAPDAASFVAAVRAETGLSLEVISGDEEARLAYLGARINLPSAVPAGASVLVFDVGGASTEFAWGRGRQPAGRRSLALGTLGLARRCSLEDAASSERVREALGEVRRLVADVEPAGDPSALLGIGATPASLLALACGRAIADGAEVHGQRLEPAVVAEQIERLRGLDAARRRRLPGLHPDRDRVILAGAVIVAGIADRWSAAPLLVSAHGLRLGLLADRFGAQP